MRRWWIIGLFLLLAAALVSTQFCSPPPGCTPYTDEWTLNRLKNRTALPQEANFDSRVTLAAILQPGEDRERWSASQAAAVEGYVVAVKDGGIESANCYSLLRRDTHVEVALRPDAPPRERLVVEVTPQMREWAQGQGWDWSTAALGRELVGRWCHTEGWLFFDSHHAKDSENTAPGGARNWRATAWEIHPVTRLTVSR